MSQHHTWRGALAMWVVGARPWATWRAHGGRPGRRQLSWPPRGGLHQLSLPVALIATEPCVVHWLCASRISRQSQRLSPRSTVANSSAAQLISRFRSQIMGLWRLAEVVCSEMGLMILRGLTAKLPRRTETRRDPRARQTARLMRQAAYPCRCW